MKTRLSRTVRSRAFDQREAEIPRQIRVLEVGFVERSGCQQHHARMIAPVRRRQGHQAVAIARGRTRRAAARDSRETPPAGSATARFDSPARSRRRTAPVCDRRAPATDHPAIGPRSTASRCTYTSFGTRDAVTRPQKRRVREHQRRREHALAQQPLRAVQIREDQIEQTRSLQQRAFDAAPLRRLDEQRHHVQRPRPIDALWIAVDVVGHAVVANRRAWRPPSATTARAGPGPRAIGRASRSAGAAGRHRPDTSS